MATIKRGKRMPNTREYSLQIVCPHCAMMTAIVDWPADSRTPFAFTCVRKRGGCGGHAIVEPPDVGGFPQLAVYLVTPAPLTPGQYAYVIGRK